jgi:hypothetical protein
MAVTAKLNLTFKLSSAVTAILVGGMKCWTQFWKGTTQGSFQQSLVEIGSVVSEEKIFFKFHPLFSILPLTKMAVTAKLNLTYDPMGNSHKNLLLRNHWANCNQTLVEVWLRLAQ